MKLFTIMLLVAGAISLTVATANAQVAQVVYYAPGPSLLPPLFPRATTVYYSPVPTTAYYAPAPTTAYYGPTPVTAYYAPAPVVAAPVPVTTTYYRPLIGGTITRTRYIYPAVPYAAPVTTTYYAPY
jgi:hypothetical protein